MMKGLLNKIKVLFIVTFIVLSVVFYYTLKNFHNSEIKQLIQENILMSESIQSYVSDYQRPAIEKLFNENNISNDFFEPSIMSSSFIVSRVNEIFTHYHSKEHQHTHENIGFKLVSDNPTNPNNKANKLESEILKKINDSNISVYEDIIEGDGKDIYLYAIPVRANTKECLVCHGDPKDAPKGMIEMYGSKNGFNENIGDVRAINIRYSTIDEDNSMIIFYLIIETMMLFIYLSIYFILRHFVIELEEKDNLIVKQSKFAAMGEMISMIAHQWRQPITGIGMTANNMLLSIELKDVDENVFKKHLETINKQVEYLSNTIDDFKNFFRPNDKSDILDINGLIDDTCTIIKSTLKSKGINVEKNYLEGVSVVTKRNDLIQIVLNIIKNAIDAYSENDIRDGVIQITTSETLEDVSITIKDFAGGIPSAILDKIFDPYFSTKDQKNGTGLGLYMSKMIIESHIGGKLLVETKGKSTTFKIIIPK